MDIIYLLIGAVIGNFMSSISKDKIKNKSKSEDIYITLFRLYPIMAVYALFIFNLITVGFQPTDGIPQNIKLVAVGIFAIILTYWVILLYASSLMGMFKPNKEILQYYLFSALMIAISVYLSIGLNIKFMTGGRLYAIAFILTMLIVLNYTQILKEYCKVTKR